MAENGLSGADEGSPALSETRRAKPLLGTIVDIRVQAEGSTAHDAITRAFAEVTLIHRLMSFHEPASDVSAINRAAVGERIGVDARTAEVLRFALALQETSGGCFDMTVADRLVASGFLPRHPGAAPRARLHRSGPPLTLDGNEVRKERPCLIDLGGVAKGYAVDRALEILVFLGAASAIVNAGGDLRQAGAPGATVHLRDPVCATRVAASLHLRDMALASSSSARLQADEAQAFAGRVTLFDGRDRQALHAGAGASVCAPSCMAADALTKVVLASADARHPALAAYGARTILYRTSERLAA